jgi:hypothetical protein
MKKNEKKSLKPFGIEHLVEVPDAEAQRVNGGRRGRNPAPTPPPVVNPGGPIFHTNYISLPSGAHPTGDHG